jgi:hypothetical protein
MGMSLVSVYVCVSVCGIVSKHCTSQLGDLEDRVNWLIQTRVLLGCR